MAGKRDILEQLTRDELLQLADRYGVEPPDRRAKAGVVEALVRSRRLDLAIGLAALPRERLKDICRATGIDDAGKEKASIAIRIAEAVGGTARKAWETRRAAEPAEREPEEWPATPPTLAEVTHRDAPDESESAGDDVESEDTGEDAPAKPWDPAKIRVTTKTYSIRHVFDEIVEKTIDLAPDFQREYVWRERQKTRLVESILLGIPLPSFYFNADEENRAQVVDGVQRLTTIHAFKKGEFELSSDLEYLQPEEGKKFDQLSPALRRRFDQTQIVVHVIEPTTPPEVKYDIFRRINTGGTPLSAQEIRHCMSKPRSRALLRELIALEELRAAVPGLRDTRMIARELTLRSVAFYRLGSDLASYAKWNTLDEFLLATTRELDDPAIVPDDELVRIRHAFTAGMRNANIVFGEHAFRKWPLGSAKRKPLNRALFESWSVALADLREEQAWDAAVQIAAAARDAMTTDTEYAAAISYGTGKPEQVRRRFERARAIVAGAVT